MSDTKGKPLQAFNDLHDHARLKGGRLELYTGSLIRKKGAGRNLTSLVVDLPGEPTEALNVPNNGGLNRTAQKLLKALQA